MLHADLQKTIETAFEARDTINTGTKGAVRDAVTTALDLLDSGQVRVAEKKDGQWAVNQWLKKAVLLSFRLHDNEIIPFQKSGTYASRVHGYDKVPLKYGDWSAQQFKDAGFRAVPGAIVRHSAYIAPGVVLMPSFVNLGAYVDSGTMVDT
ncbi:MAG: 2,3,4,5-tetrahydropyridine-2,6-dicarboxylate N-succinyltransferase, partial [Hyphomicrobiaceae bacterium]|nr:2,3,4,5-tetrahydropyridine-2,6-dicarboxylate N-succinyltransferase [Hyphomicrobiaceae bacterium]